MSSIPTPGRPWLLQPPGLSGLVLLREATDGEPPTLTVPSRLRFASTEALDAFTVELTEQLGRLVRKYHDETDGVSYWFVLG